MSDDRNEQVLWQSAQVLIHGMSDSELAILILAAAAAYQNRVGEQQAVARFADLPRAVREVNNPKETTA